MKYEKARAEMVLFDNSDVITASSPKPCTGPSSRLCAASLFYNGTCDYTSSEYDPIDPEDPFA